MSGIKSTFNKVPTLVWALLWLAVAIVFAYLILIMVFKPSGLLGEETREAG